MSSPPNITLSHLSQSMQSEQSLNYLFESIENIQTDIDIAKEKREYLRSVLAIFAESDPILLSSLISKFKGKVDPGINAQIEQTIGQLHTNNAEYMTTIDIAEIV